MRHSSLSLWLFPLILPLVLVCSPDTRRPMGVGDLGDGMKVLFIGNSLTAFNDLPAMVQALGEVGGKKIAVRSVTAGDYSLKDHWNTGEAVRAIRAADWDVVVLQQGPSSLAPSRGELLEFTQAFDAVIRQQGARTALYMVWPESTRPATFDAVTDSYTMAAEAVDGMLFPVGEAWRAAWARDANLDLYDTDGFDPSPLGSALGALVIYQQLFGEFPVGLSSPSPSTTPILPSVTLLEEVPLLLQEAAAQANAGFGRR